MLSCNIRMQCTMYNVVLHTYACNVQCTMLSCNIRMQCTMLSCDIRMQCTMLSCDIRMQCTMLSCNIRMLCTTLPCNIRMQCTMYTLGYNVHTGVRACCPATYACNVQCTQAGIDWCCWKVWVRQRTKHCKNYRRREQKLEGVVFCVRVGQLMSFGSMNAFVIQTTLN